MRNTTKLLIAIAAFAFIAWAVSPNTDPCGNDAACIKYMHQLNDGIKD